jgi:hypothetical protein
LFHGLRTVSRQKMWSDRLTRTRVAFLMASGTADVCVLSSK